MLGVHGKPVVNRDLLTVPACSERVSLDALTENAQAVRPGAELDAKNHPAEKDDDDGGSPEMEAIPVNLLIAKQRNGPTGDVHLTFFKSFTRFESAAKVSDVPVD